MQTFIRVAPLRRLPVAMSVFDYEWPFDEQPHVGALVDVPFRGASLFAIISEVLTQSPFKTRPLTSALHIPLLSSDEIKWLSRIGAQYAEPLGILCERMLPPIQIRTAHTLQRNHWKISKSKPRLEYAWYKDNESFFETLNETLKKYSDQPRIILTYSQEAAEELYSQLIKIFSPVFLYDAASTPKRRAAWSALMDTLPPIIIGTHSSLWLPHHVHTQWIFVEPSHEAHVTWDGAHYSNRTILSDRCKTFGESVTCVAHSPDTPELAHDVHLPAMTHWPITIDRTTEDPKNRGALFSSTTEESLHAGSRVLLLVQHLKEATHVICKDCGRLTPYDSTRADAVCAACGGAQFITIGGGGAAIDSYIKKNTEEARVAQLMDAKNFSELSPDEPCIIIATLQLFDKLPLATFDTIIDLASDIEFKFPQFDTEERTWKRLRACAARLPTTWHGRWLVETRHPERAAWRVRDHKGFQAWWQHELPLRTRFQQPPFATLKKNAA